ncbi:unnamed protein product [Mytilus coruscus]|uniref:G-protein coupled receptors family 1 profile domain-containing protein n=1 Tax=Mytilus coruscus TaxID=42192 RepID=A0A6J8CXX1_MYTCO|nr:unnamed protein product [Mytilus coruscus]
MWSNGNTSVFSSEQSTTTETANISSFYGKLIDATTKALSDMTLQNIIEAPSQTNGTVYAGRPGGPSSRYDESYYVFSEETVDLIRKVCYLGICPVMIIVGLILNIMCFVLFWRTNVKSSTVCMLMALAVADIIYVLNAGVNSLFVASSYYDIPFTADQRTQAIPYFYSYIRVLPGRFGSILTLLISLERMFSVLKPIEIRQYATRKNAITAITVITVLTILLNAPLALVNRTEKIYINATKTYIRIVVRTELGKNTFLVDSLYVVIESLFGFLPVLLISLSCSVTAAVVYSSAKRRSTMTSSTKNNKEMQVTRTLLVLIFVFIVCKAPAVLLGLIIFVEMKPYEYDNNAYIVARSITYIPLLLNSVVNLIIYYNTSTVYRKQIKIMLGCSSRNIKTVQNSTKQENFSSTPNKVQRDVNRTYSGEESSEHIQQRNYQNTYRRGIIRTHTEEESSEHIQKRNNQKHIQEKNHQNTYKRGIIRTHTEEKSSEHIQKRNYQNTYRRIIIRTHTRKESSEHIQRGIIRTHTGEESSEHIQKRRQHNIIIYKRRRQNTYRIIVC